VARSLGQGTCSQTTTATGCGRARITPPSLEPTDAPVFRANPRCGARPAGTSLSRSGMMASRGAAQRVLCIFTEVFANGGIQRFNQTMLDACGNLTIDCQVLSL